MEAWSPIVRIPSPPSFLGALDRKSRNSLKEPELVRSGKSLESLAFAMLYDQGHIKFTDRLAKDIILPCNDINSQSISIISGSTYHYPFEIRFLHLEKS